MVWGYARRVKPALLEWSAATITCTKSPVRTSLATLKARHGWEHASTLSALRSLFRCCKRRGVIFGDPTSRIHLGRHPTGMILPLAPGDIAEAVAAATTAAARLLLALAAVHAARRKAMRELRLEDVDLGGRRLTIAGRVRPLDDLTRRAILDWLAYRRLPTRPACGTASPTSTPNPHPPTGSGCWTAWPASRSTPPTSAASANSSTRAPTTATNPCSAAMTHLP